MTDLNTDLRTALQKAQSDKEQGRVPGFDDVWSGAVRRARNANRRRRAFAATGIAAVAAVLVLRLWPSIDDGQRYIDLDDLLETTHWRAPSDSLMPEHEIDIYRDIPVLIESTDTYGGALL